MRMRIIPRRMYVRMARYMYNTEMKNLRCVGARPVHYLWVKMAVAPPTRDEDSVSVWIIHSVKYLPCCYSNDICSKCKLTIESR